MLKLEMAEEKKRVALVCGVTGIAGLEVSRKLVAEGGWKVYGVSRRTQVAFLPDEVIHVACDMANAEDCAKKITPLDDITHVFYTAWVRELKDEAIACENNGAMFRTLLESINTKTLSNVVLLTGIKHYVWNQTPESGRTQIITTNISPHREEQARLPGINFYYTTEDILREMAKKKGFTWGVTRVNTVIGLAGVARKLAVQASMCRYLNEPFTFFGGPFTYKSLWEFTDGDLLAEHMVWVGTEPKAANGAFNCVNGDMFRWERMYQHIAEYFGIKVEIPPKGEIFPIEKYMWDREDVWEKMIKEYGLCTNRVKSDDLWGPVFTYIAVCLEKNEQELLMDMNKSRDAGFLGYRDTEKSFWKIFDTLVKNKMIPDFNAEKSNASS